MNTTDLNDLKFQPYVKITRLKPSEIEKWGINEFNTKPKQLSLIRHDYDKENGNENKRKVMHSLPQPKRVKYSNESTSANNAYGDSKRSR